MLPRYMAARVGFALDPRQALADADELDLVKLGARLGYESGWTPSGTDAAAFDRCLRWHQASELPIGISVFPVSGVPPRFCADHARRAWEGTGRRFILGIGSGNMAHPAFGMRRYVAELRRLLPPNLPLYIAALGPLMLAVAGELADGVLLNWCSDEMVVWSRKRVEEAAVRAGRPMPVIASYVRTSVDQDASLARSTLAAAMLQYALGPRAYQRHFERMGFGDELRRLEASGGQPSTELMSAAGAAGAPGEVGPQFKRLARHLDLAIVRVLVTRSGDAASARCVLDECGPSPPGPSGRVGAAVSG